MLYLTLNHLNNKNLLGILAGALNLPYNGEDYLFFTPEVGAGGLKMLEITEGVQVILIDAMLSRRLIVRRQPSDKRFYVLHFEDFFVSNSLRLEVDGEVLQKSQEKHSIVRLTSNVFSNAEELSPNTPVRALKIFFSEAWLKKYLGLDDQADGLQQYIALKTASVNMEPLDDTYLGIMNGIWSLKKDDPIHNIALQNRITLLLERFFARLAEKKNLLEGKPGIPQNDLEQLIRVEQMLIKDLTEKPPKIEILTRQAVMNATTLKKRFKEMFGSSIYNYYQNARMQKARDFLVMNKCSIKETAATFGFGSAANFSTAFKKQFNISPSDFVKNM